MGTGSLLHDGDADLLVAVLDAEGGDDAGGCDDPGPMVPWSLLDCLSRLVPAAWTMAYEERPCGSFLLLQCLAGDGTRSVVRSGAERSGDPVRTGDVRSALPAEVTEELVLPVPAPPGEGRRFVFLRSSGPAFDERDRRVLQLLRPHLHGAWLAADRRRADVPPLSPREWEVLALAGAGLSTAEIAVALWISVGTARKHMEHIRVKLGVHTMAAAAAQALPHAPGARPTG